MLRACRKLLRTGGRLAYLTIVAAPDLTPAQARVAVELGPRAVTAIAPDGELMERAGYDDISVNDVTRSFLSVARAWHREFARKEVELKRVLGDEVWEERQVSRSGLMRAVGDGLLRRILVGGRVAAR